MRAKSRFAAVTTIALLVAACSPAAASPSPTTTTEPAGSPAPDGSAPAPSAATPPPAAADLPTIRVPASLSGLNGFLQRVALDKGHFSQAGITVQALTFGDAEDNVLLLSGGIEFAPLAPIDVAVMRNEGADTTLLGGVFNQHAMILVKSDDDRTLAELEGTNHGQIGLGSTTSRQLQVALNATEGIDYASFFEHVVSGTPTLEPLLARGDVESISMFPPRSVAFEASGLYKPVYGPVSDAWSETSGFPLMLGGVAMSEQFARDNPEAVRRFVAGLEATAAYIEENADALVEEYAGILGIEDADQRKAFAEALKGGDYYDTDLTPERIAAEQEFLEIAQEVGFLPEIPDGIFTELSEL